MKKWVCALLCLFLLAQAIPCALAEKLDVVDAMIEETAEGQAPEATNAEAEGLIRLITECCGIIKTLPESDSYRSLTLTLGLWQRFAQDDTVSLRCHPERSEGPVHFVSNQH